MTERGRFRPKHGVRSSMEKKNPLTFIPESFSLFHVCMSDAENLSVNVLLRLSAVVSRLLLATNLTTPAIIAVFSHSSVFVLR